MARVSEYPTATALTGAELAYVVQGGASKKATLTDIVALTDVVELNSQTGTSYTLVLADSGRYIRHSNASPSTVTVPPNSSVAFPVGTQLHVRQAGAGQVTLVQGSGVTLVPPFGGTLALAGQGATVSLVKVATNTWDVLGQVA
jgi:hypothetical protein